MTTPNAVVIATASALDGSAAALLLTPEGRILTRTIAQLRLLGVGLVQVLTRPDWLPDIQSALAAVDDVEVRAVGTPAEGLRAVAEFVADHDSAPLVILDGELVAHDAALDAVLCDPRVETGVLFTRAGSRRALLHVRVERGRLVAAESAYHRAAQTQAVALGVLKIAANDRSVVRETADELSTLLAGPLPDGWDEELGAKVDRWTDLQDVEHARERVTRDLLALLLVGIVRSGTPVAGVLATPFPCVRAYSEDMAASAVALIGGVDADRYRLSAAVKSRDGFVTTFLVSPYSRYIARWAARRGLRPNQITVLSMALGIAAGGLFALGTRAGLVSGALMLWAAFVADCVDGQLARYTRQFSKLGAWLDALFDRAKEYVVFAGLAAGGIRAGQDHSLWVLAVAALTLQVTRHAIAFSYGLSQRSATRTTPQPTMASSLVDPGDSPEPAESIVAADTELLGDDQPQRRSLAASVGRAGVRASRFFEQRRGLKWAKRIFVLPIGERFLLIAVTAAVSGPRTVFVVVLAWGTLALVYTASGRVLRSVV